MVKKLFLCLLPFFSLSVNAADTPFEFHNDADEQRFKSLIEELRCLVCQNQSLADSHAELAQDLRDEVYTQMYDGLSNAEIISFLVTRYGDFILYRPPLKKHTWILWFGPFVLLFASIVIIIRLIINNSHNPRETLTQEQKEQVASLLQNKDEGAT